MLERWTTPDRHGSRYLRTRPARALQIVGLLVLALVIVPAFYGRVVAEPIGSSYRWQGQPIYLVGDSLNVTCRVQPDNGDVRDVSVPGIPRLAFLDGVPVRDDWFTGPATVRCFENVITSMPDVRVMTGAWASLARTADYSFLFVIVGVVLLGIGHGLRYRPDEDHGVSGAERSRVKKPWYKRL